MNQSDNNIRTSIPILGLDTVTPDRLVDDGKCETLHNLRHTGNTWRNIKPLKLKYKITKDNGFRIIYKHPASAENVYIASKTNTDGTINLYQVIVEEEAILLLSDTIRILFNKTREGFHFHWCYITASKPVLSNISMTVVFRSNQTGIVAQMKRLTIPIGEDHSETLTIPETQTVSVIKASLTPISDSGTKYKYAGVKLWPIWGSVTDTDSIAPSLPINFTLHHFGNVLLVGTDNDTKKLMLRNNDYDLLDINAITLSTEVDRRLIMFAPDMINERKDIELPSGNNGHFEYVSSVFHHYLKLYNINDEITYLPQGSGDFWNGEICCFVALRMKDGTILKQSKLHIISSEPYSIEEKIENRDGYKIIKMGDQYFLCIHSEEYGHRDNPPKTEYTPNNFMISPTLRVIIKNYEDVSQYVDDITLYATRINPRFDHHKFMTIYKNWENSFPNKPFPDDFPASRNYDAIFADNKLAEQPFYIIKSFSLSDIKNDVLEIKLTHALLQNAELSKTYEPNQFAHEINFSKMREYNSRAHLFGISTKFFNGFGESLIAKTNETTTAGEFNTFITHIERNDATIQTQSPIAIDHGTCLENILSYPDAYATKMFIAKFKSDALYDIYKTIEFKKSLALNHGYYIRPRYTIVVKHTVGNVTTEEQICTLKYPLVNILDNVEQVNYKITTPDRIYEKNRMQISASNNIFNLPFANSYKIGTDNNRILAINSGAIEMSDAKFGEFPLYVFTDEGMFAMQSGSGEVLYAATVPINYDRIINPNTLAVNYNILYITTRGLHALYSNQSKLISTALNDPNNQPPLDYLTTAQLCYHPKFNEIIVWNETKNTGNTPKYDYAFVYALEGGYWSTRSFSGGKLNTSEIIDNSIFEISEESPATTPVTARITSRPIKFGSMEFKRLETLIPRLVSDRNQSIRFVLEASVDQKTWMPLRTIETQLDRDVVFRRVPYSFRYLRICMDATLTGDFEISGFDAEYYLRFTHKLR
ncbi:MAG: hypothetical protein RSB23_06595 [Alistipes sp.]